jgi:ferredoxin
LWFRGPRGASATGFCLRGLNLLAHAQAIELDIGSECGGHGVCGRDRVRVSGGEVSPVTDAERRHLTAAELAAGWRLGCQCFPERDGASLRAELP